MELNQLKAVVIDLETTGLHKRTDRIIEIGAWKLRQGRVVDSFSVLLDPGFPLSEDTMRITGITDEMLSGCRHFAQIADELEVFLGEDVLVGHSIAGDYAFLKKAFVDCRPRGYVFEKQGIDTLKLARQFLPADEKKSLSEVCARYGYHFSPHRASDDAKATLFLLQKLYEEFGARCPEAFDPVRLCFAVKKDSPVMEKQKQKIREMAQNMKVEISEKRLSALTKSQAARLIDKARAGEKEMFMNLLSQPPQ